MYLAVFLTACFALKPVHVLPNIPSLDSAYFEPVENHDDQGDTEVAGPKPSFLTRLHECLHEFHHEPQAGMAVSLRLFEHLLVYYIGLPPPHMRPAFTTVGAPPPDAEKKHVCCVWRLKVVMVPVVIVR
jgi:hypothetical protein